MRATYFGRRAEKSETSDKTTTPSIVSPRSRLLLSARRQAQRKGFGSSTAVSQGFESLDGAMEPRSRRSRQRRTQRRRRRLGRWDYGRRTLWRTRRLLQLPRAAALQHLACCERRGLRGVRACKLRGKGGRSSCRTPAAPAHPARSRIRGMSSRPRDERQ